MNWLMAAILATLSFGFFGLFDKLSTFQNPVLSNFIIYLTTVVSGLALFIIKGKKITFSKEAYLSGLFAGVAGLSILYALLSNFVIIVFPFVSFSSVIFFFIIFFSEKPKLSNNQKLLVSTGIIISIIGLIVASTSTIGGLYSFLNSFRIEIDFFILGLLISVSCSLWSFFSFVAVKKKNVEIINANLLVVLGCFTTALIAFAFIGILNSSIISNFQDVRNIFPIFSGLAIFSGSVFTLKAYKITTGKSRIQETVVAILTNAEILPLIFLSYFILNEFTVEGFVGAFTVFIGLLILNYAEKM